jgi:quinol monooxygenase YgiN
MTKQAIHMVEVDCKPEVEIKYNKWYNEVHIPMILRYDGILRATRYQLLSGPPGQARYLTIYEFKDQDAMESFPKSPEYTAVDEELKQTWKGKEFEVKLAAKFEMIGTWGK